MNNMFLIPANSKKSGLILGLFKPADLIIIGVGVFITFILLLSLPIEDIKFEIMAMLPAAIAAFLVFPVAYYHNVRHFIVIAFEFFTTRQKYVWKGWCMLDEYEKYNKK